MVAECKSLVVVLLKSMRNVDIKPLARKRLHKRKTIQKSLNLRVFRYMQIQHELQV